MLIEGKIVVTSFGKLQLRVNTYQKKAIYGIFGCGKNIKLRIGKK